jgi:acetyl esterase/lipase
VSIVVRKDIVVGTAEIGHNHGRGPTRTIELRMDAYLPAGRPVEPRPAVVMAFGGAFHRGSKETDAFSDGTGTSTATSEYCRRFAGLGCAAFAVEYRLAQSDPVPPHETIIAHPDLVPMSRVDVVRREFGLPPIGPREMAAIIESATSDVAKAFRYVHSHAIDFEVDASRILIGGFSAGARCALYAAYALRVGSAGVLSISGPMGAEDAAAGLKGHDGPPLLLVTGEHDLDYVRAFAPKLRDTFAEAGTPCSWVNVPGATHFYAAETRTETGHTVFETLEEKIRQWTT